LVDLWNQNGVTPYIHENYRWQKPVRRFKEIMESVSASDNFHGYKVLHHFDCRGQP